MSVFSLRKRGRQALVVLILLFALGNSAFADHEFIEQPISWDVQYFEPVDIDGDGVWELALQVGADGDSVGVYSPLLGQWIDGPHYLPIQGNNWGCGDFDNDGISEYVYYIDLAIRHYDPEESTDSILINLEEMPDVIQVWGETLLGEPTMFCGKLHFAEWHDRLEDPMLSSYRNWCRWDRYSITHAKHLDTLYGWVDKGRACFALTEPITSYLCVFGAKSSWFNIIPGPEGGVTESWLYLISHNSARTDSISAGLIPWNNETYPMAYSYVLSSWVHMFHSAIGVSCLDDIPEIFWLVGSTWEITPPIYRYIGSAITPGTAELTWSIKADSIETAKLTGLDPTYSGMAYFDWDGDTNNELLLPHRNRGLWELRDPQTGLVIDSIMGMPPVDLRTAPIMEPDVLDLYYFQGSTLYILDRPGMPTDVFEDENATSVPSTFVLHQNYPNPFNASTVIEFSLQQGGNVVLEVFNILGQKVAILIDASLLSGTHQVSWDGTDQSGNAVTSGIYFYRLTAGDHQDVRKLSLLK